MEVDKDVDFRRTRIISKLRGQGTPTAELIRAVAASFVNGEVDIVEQPDQYTFVVKFVSIMGVPPNVEDLTAALMKSNPPTWLLCMSTSSASGDCCGPTPGGSWRERPGRT